MQNESDSSDGEEWASPEPLVHDESDESENPCKKRKITPDERFKEAREEVARIRQIEESYSNNSTEPTTIDQFERFVLST